ncbi:MAG: BrnA antitoxin family protein [Patescibacteria group bacterium]
MTTNSSNKLKKITMKLGQGKTKLSPEETAKLLALKDSDIDTTDIPEIDASWMKKAKIIDPSKKILKSIRIDEKVLNFIKNKQGKKYQTLINQILTEWSIHNGMK